jgi:arylsulfatase A-like enzyme
MKNLQNHLQRNNISNDKKSGLLSYLFLLTAFFIFLEISLFVQSSDIYLGDYKLVAAHLKVPGNVIPGILYFFFVQIVLHCSYTLVIWMLARVVGYTLQCSWKTTGKIGFGLWFVGIICILLANQHYLPNSKFSHLTGVLVGRTLGEILLWITASTLLIATLIAVWGLIVNFPRVMLGTLGTACLTAVIFSLWPMQVVQDAATADKPNIIFIGIDSLRPDFLGYYGYEKQTPHLDSFLNQSTVFAEAFTPLARTFPAWMSILTGQYPKRSGVRFNLPTVTEMSWDDNLPNMLRRAGYKTVFSTDETRFSNIDRSYGFDKTLTPPIGFNDFLLGNLNDFPLANLFVNTPLGKYLFPYSYGNRPVSITYNPNSFLDFVRPELMKSRTKPLFLAIHFCLPHFPYFWGMDSADDKSIHNYQAAVKRVDQQFQDFMQLLKDNNVLNHAIIVVLSDHGEAIELPGDRVTEKNLFIAGVNNKNNNIPHFYPPSFDFETVNQSAGHGTDVLGLTQYHIVLAFRTFGLHPNQLGDVTERVSLLDIKPTILDFLHLADKSKTDGSSLKDKILHRSSQPSIPKHFFYESDFSPQAVRSVHPETRKLLFAGIEYFQIDQVTGRIAVKKSMEKLIISSKQFADLYGEWVLALYPQSQTKMMPILVNLTSGKWTNDLNTPFAEMSPAKEMLTALRDFYGADITNIL